MRRNGIVAAAAVALAIIVDGPGASAAGGDKLRELVDRQIKALPPGITATYAAIEGDTIKGLAVHGTFDGGALDYTVGEIDLVNPNLDFAALWSAALADPSKLTADTAIALYDSAMAKDVSFHFAAKQGGDVVEASGSIASLASKGVRFYPWALTRPGVPSFADLQAFFANPPTTPDLDAAMPPIHFAVAASMAVAYDGGSAENMAYSIKLPNMPGTDAPQEVTYTIARLTGEGVDRGRLNGFSAEGVELGMGAAGGGSVERVSYAGFDMHQPLTKMLAAPTVTADMLDGAKIGKIEYSNIKVQIPDQAPVTIGAISMGDIAFDGPVPVSGRFALERLEISKDAVQDPEAQAAFEQLGLDRMTLSMGAAYSWNLAEKRIKLDDVVVKVDELGALNLAAEVTEVTPDMAGATGAQLAHARLTFSDASLVDRAFKAGASMQQQDPAAFRRQMTDELQQMSAQYTGDSPPLAAASKAVMEFLGAPKSLAVELAPPKPLPIMQLATLAATPPAQIAAMVGLVVTANK
jgi:hypothetical protein